MKNNLIAFVLLATLVALPLSSFAKGGGGGGRSSSSYSSSRSTSTRTTTPTRVTTPRVTTPKTPTVSKTPSTSTVKVTSPVTKKVNGTTFSKKGSVVDSTYQPKFNGGYTPPIGSTVYYRQSSLMDWLPFYLILNSQNAHRDAIVTEPAKDGQPAVEKVVKEEGLDTMYVVNWVMSILLVLGLIGLIVYLVNRKTNKYV